MALDCPPRGQALRATGAGDHAELDFRLAEFGVVGGDDEVAHHGEFTATAQREAADGRDHRLADGADGFPVAGDEIAAVGVGKGGVGH